MLCFAGVRPANATKSFTVLSRQQDPATKKLVGFLFDLSFGGTNAGFSLW